MRSRIWPIVGGLAALGAARRYYRHWGSTKGECRMPLPGDDLLVARSMQLTDAVSIDRCAAEVWPWLLQMGQDRAGLFSYEALESRSRLRRRGIDDVRPEWRLAPGDVIRLTPRGWLGLCDGVALAVTELVEGQAIVLRAAPPELPCAVVWSFHLLPRGADRCRLLVRTRIARRHRGDVVLTEAAGLLAMVMTRAVLLGIRRCAESQRGTDFVGSSDRRSGSLSSAGQP